MKKIASQDIIKKVSLALANINTHIDPTIERFLKNKLSMLDDRERKIVDILMKNSEIAGAESIPLCQDTGSVVVFATIGNEVQLEDDLQSIINRSVRESYERCFFRKSITRDPLKRENTKDNTPAIIHIESVKGDICRFEIAAKGGGSENISALRMLKPADGEQGIIDFVLTQIADNGKNACPPLIIGIGIGGNFETCAKLSKKALFRDIGSRHREEYYSFLEQRILNEVNMLGIGAGGYGGLLTAMDVFIETAPCHIASLPVAINVGCHSNRHTVVEM